jgi:hypothetical protein
MPYFLIQDFSKGLDARKSPVTLPAGSLRYANNVHVTRGGELEKRKAFVPWCQLEPGSIGLAADRDELVVYGGVAQTLPVGIKQVLGGLVFNPTTDHMMDTTRWRDGLLTTLLTNNGTNRRMILNDAEITTWAWTTDPMTLAPKPSAVRTYRGKVYGAEDANLYGSKLYDPNVWGDGSTGGVPDDWLGSFVTDTAMASEYMSKINALAVFQGSLVVFSEDGIQVWDVDPDPNKNTLTRSLTNTGCLSPRTVMNFGNFDVVFLAKSGIRSLKARQLADVMNVQDIGTPVDNFVSELISLITPGVLRYKAFSAVEPESARLFMSLGDVIMVHSYYEGSGIAAWTTYTPGFQIDGMATLGSDLFVRSGDTIYKYGGNDRQTYDACKAEVWTPFHHAEKPATMKAFTGFDVGCEGEWSVGVATDPKRVDVVEQVGRVIGTTFAEPNEPLANWSTHMSLVLESSDVAPVTLSTLAMHYTEGVAQ